MEIDLSTEAYLRGRVVEGGQLFRVVRQPVVTREALLVGLVKGKKVLHVGCADHISLIAGKMKQGKYLHQLLGESARHLVGVDTNWKGLEGMRSKGFKNIFHVDELSYDESFDLLIVPDVIEHVGNVQQFLGELRNYKAREIVVTTPNAFRWKNRILFTREFVNTDHKYWFSPYTLARTLYEAKYSIKEFYYTDRLSWLRPIASYIKWQFPICREGLAVVVERSAD